MPIPLPDPIATFFQVSNGAEDSALTLCLAEDAVVRDEGRTHQGHEAIRSWLREARRTYTYRVEPLDAAQEGTRVKVQAKVAGNFPGSPIQLTHVFQLAGGRIESLEIRA